MAYKFQVGHADMSGSLTQLGAIIVSGSLSASAAIDGVSLKMGGTEVISSARAVANITSVDGSGDLTMGTISMAGFSVDADGDTALKSLAVDDSSTIGCDSDADLMTLAAQSLTLAADAALTYKGTAITATGAELNYVDVSSIGTVEASKAVVVDSDKDISGFRNVTATGYFEIGNAQLTEAEMEQLDGVTAGTVAASKVVVVDSDKDISGFRNVTATGYFEIGSAQLTEAEMEMLDGITAGTAAASKAVVLDASKNITGINLLTASAMSASIVQGTFYGDGANLTGISSDTVDTTTSDASATRYIPFVDQATGADGETLLIHSALSINPSTGVFGVAGSAPGLTVGSAVLSEAELEVLDGVTAGTVAASKVVVADANKDASGFRNVTGTGAITAGTSFIIGAADLNEADMEKLDGITNGTAAASKAVVLDASKDISGLNDVAAAGLTLSDLTSGRLPLVYTRGLQADNAQITYDVGRNLNGYNSIAVSSSLSGAAYLGDGLLYIADQNQVDILFANGQGVGMGYDNSLDGGNGDNVFYFSPSDGEIKLQYDGTSVYFGKDSDVELLHVADTGLRLNSTRQLQFGDAGTYIHQSADGVLDLVADSEIEINATNIDVNGILDVSGNSTLGGTLTAASLGTIADGDIDLTADLMIANDSATGAIKNMSLANYAGKLAGGSNEGLSSTAGRLGLDLNDLAAAAVSVANDSIAIIDADGSNASKKESIADLVAAMAGSGLTATNGVLSSDASPTPNDIGDASATLQEGMNFTDTDFTAARSWTLPASADSDLGDIVRVKAPKNAATYTLTVVKGSGQTIDGVSQDLLLESNNAAVSFVYVAANAWMIV
jgi:hypothetical protein